MKTDCSQQLTFWNVGRQQVTVDFEGGQVVSDAGLLQVRQFERQLGVIAGLARRLPDPREQKFVTHTSERVLTQEVYQLLAGYADCNDANTLRHDPLFQTLADVPVDDEQQTLASGSTLSRFQYAYTRRQRQLPREERPAFFEQRQAQLQRVEVLNDYLVDLFLHTRRQPPQQIVIDLDATDDPTHGQQVLSFYHGYYRQHQYYPLLLFDGETGFPLGAWLRPGTAHASWGAIDSLDAVIQKLRAAWPDATILVRGDNGLATPEMYEYCEREQLSYAFGYSINAVLERRTAQALSDLKLYYRLRGEAVQRFESFQDYQAESWSCPRRIVAKVEINAHGTNRRFVVTNLNGSPQEVYHGFYVKRGNVPEKPIGELKNGLQADRLSSHGFSANSFRFLQHVLAYAIIVLHREATAEVEEVARAEVSTLRGKLFKVGAVVKTSVRRIWFHFSSTWPYRDLFLRIQAALDQFVRDLRGSNPVVPDAAASLPF